MFANSMLICCSRDRCPSDCRRVEQEEEVISAAHSNLQLNVDDALNNLVTRESGPSPHQHTRLCVNNVDGTINKVSIAANCGVDINIIINIYQRLSPELRWMYNA